MSFKSFVKLALAVPVVFMVYCTVSPNAKGGTDTGNPVICGKLLDKDGNPAVGAVVTMIPVDYVPSGVLFKTAFARTVVCTTDSKGEYRIYAIDSLCYNFEAHQDSCGVFRDSVKVVLDSREHRMENMTLAKVGRVFGVTQMLGQSDTNQVRLTLYFPGTNRIIKPAIGGAFMFDQMPAGDYQLIIDPTLNSFNVKVLDIHLNVGEQLNLGVIKFGAEPDTFEINTSSVKGTWGPGKTYNVYTTISVNQGDSLIIRPGTTIRFFGVPLLISGRLLAQGTADSLIRFCSGSGNTWSGLEIQQYYDSLLLSYCIVDHAKTGIEDCWKPSKMEIRNCVFRYCEVVLISEMENPGCFNFHNTVFHNNGYNTTSVHLGTIWIDGINGIGGIACKLDNCIFADNRMVIKLAGTENSTAVEANNCCFFNNANDFMESNSLDTLSFIKGNFVNESSSIKQDPLFMSLEPGKEDYHFQNGSPCIKAGTQGTDIGLYGNY